MAAALKNRLVASAAALLALASSLVGCRPNSPTELRIGIVLPMSGSLQSLAGFAMEGARLAVSQLEAAGGLTVGDRLCRVVLLTRDAETSPELAVAAAQELINKESVSAIIGPPISSQAIPVAQLAARTGVPMVFQFATHPEVTRGTTNVIRICFVDTFQGTVLARFAWEGLGARRAAILYDDTSPLPKTIAGVFRDQFEGQGGQIVAYVPFTAGDTDHRASLRRVAESRADVLFLPDYRADLLVIGPQLREVGIEAQILGCDTMRFATPADAQLFDGAFVTAHFAGDSPARESRDFAEAFRSAYNRTPSDGAALTYDAVNLLIQVARSERSVEPGAVARGISRISEFRGATGTMLFAGSADPVKSVVIARITDGNLVFHAQVDP
jgi:branched-chain amino acid transport system substrate-binding protein